MKNLSLLVWLTQLGFSVAVPLGGFVLLAVWLQRRFDLGAWVIVLGVLLGVLVAASGLKNSLKTMARAAEDQNEKQLPVNFNDHE